MLLGGGICGVRRIILPDSLSNPGRSWHNIRTFFERKTQRVSNNLRLVR
jgi:hypothetical protein